MTAGRKPLEITEAMIERAFELASQGLTKKQIAISLGFSHTTLYEKFQQFPEFLDAVERGQVNGIQQVSNALFNKAIDGNVAAIQTYLYNRDPENWKREPTESATKDIPPINITLVTDDPNQAAN